MLSSKNFIAIKFQIETLFLEDLVGDDLGTWAPTHDANLISQNVFIDLF
jgi:hypothetical protein